MSNRQKPATIRSPSRQLAQTGAHGLPATKRLNQGVVPARASRNGMLTNFGQIRTILTGLAACHRPTPRSKCRQPSPGTDTAGRCGRQHGERREGIRPPYPGSTPSRKPSKPTLYPQKGRSREPPLPDLAGMMAHRAGSSRHNRPSCRQEIPFIGRYLEFVCVQVRVRLGNPAILHAQRPTGGTVRMGSPRGTESTI